MASKLPADISDPRVLRRILADSGFKTYDSGELTIENVGASQGNHGLGGYPMGMMAFLKCVSANLNYTVGEIVEFPVWSGPGHMLTATATQIRMNMWGVTNSRIQLPNKTSGGLSYITEANWRLIMKAWR